MIATLRYVDTVVSQQVKVFQSFPLYVPSATAQNSQYCAVFAVCYPQAVRSACLKHDGWTIFSGIGQCWGQPGLGGLAEIRPGPGDNRIARGCIACNSSTVSSSFLSTTWSHMRLPKYCKKSSEVSTKVQEGRGMRLVHACSQGSWYALLHLHSLFAMLVIFADSDG